MDNALPQQVTYRFSGHDAFPCRYTWLPKAVRHLSRDANLFSDEDKAMVRLGVGKNMVRALRFWAEAARVIEVTSPGNVEISRFGRDLLGNEGYDEYLEDIRTLWLIHWKIATNPTQPLFAWHHLLNLWHRPDFTRTEVLGVFQTEVEQRGKKLSEVTLDHHFTTFLHTYIPTGGRKGEVVEDNLDCPLVELELILKVGERTTADSGRLESIYAFRVEEKPDISPELFIYCLDEFWNQCEPGELTLTFRNISVGEGSPGQIFKLPEQDIRERLERIEKDSDGYFTYQESGALQLLKRRSKPGQEELFSSDDLLRKIYWREE